MLLSDFRAKKLPDFYRKYNTEQSSGDNSSFTAQHKDSDLFPQTQPIEKFLEIPGKIRKRRFFEVTIYIEYMIGLYEAFTVFDMGKFQS